MRTRMRRASEAASETAVAAGPAPAGAYGVCGLTLLFGFGWALLVLTHLDDPTRSPDIPYAWGGLLLSFGLALSGLFILVHRAGQGLGWTLLSTGLLQIAALFLHLTLSVAEAGSFWVDFSAAVELVSNTAFIFTMYALPLWFPHGRLPGRWGRATAVVLLLWSATQAYYDVAPTPDWYGLGNPLRHGGWAQAYTAVADALDPVIVWLAPAIILVNCAFAAARWWRSSRRRAQQWAVLLPYVIWLTFIFVGYRLPWQGTTGFAVFSALISGVWPLAVGYAFARDRSWQLDRAGRRGLASFVLVGALITGYFALALVLPKLLPKADTAGAQLMAVCALGVGMLLQPTARAVSRAVDRFYYGDRALPYQVARDLAERLSQAVGPAEAPPLLCTTVVRALGLPGARVVVTTRSGPRELAVQGEVGAAAEVFPITSEGAEIGELHAPPRSGQATLDRQDRTVLRFLADQSGPALASLRLNEELQASRKRLVLAREEERKRLRHDLHDGLGPTLSGLRLQIDTARSGLPPDSTAAASLCAASTGIGTAIDELRRITDGLAPAELGRVGLTCALRELGTQLDGHRLHITVDLDPDPLPQLPAAVEVALYRISGEALNNVLRHSGATRARLALRVAADEITVEASDDGGGFPAHNAPTGVGLRSMAERAEELGGTFTAANDARGAVVRAVLPRGGAA